MLENSARVYREESLLDRRWPAMPCRRRLNGVKRKVSLLFALSANSVIYSSLRGSTQPSIRLIMSVIDARTNAQHTPDTEIRAWHRLREREIAPHRVRVI